MNLIKSLILLVVCICSIDSFARKGIRTIRTSDKAIKTIYLALGRSTVLKFIEKPEKIVLGNQNYYNAEYIDNDVTLQPLGAVDTNLFVYTKSKRTYSFLLKIVSPAQYNDIVHVRWKSSYRPLRPKPKKQTYRKQKRIKPVSFKVGKPLFVTISKFVKTVHSKSYFVEIELQNKGKKVINKSEVQIYLTRNKKKLSNQNLFFLNESVKPNERTKTRVFITLESLKGFTVNVKFKKKRGFSIISRKYL